MSTMYLAFNQTVESGTKIGDSLVSAHALRLMIENEFHDKYILSVNPSHPLNFCFDQLILEHNIEVIEESWPIGDTNYIYRMFDQRRKERLVNKIPFDTHKEIYLRIHGGKRQGELCGSERGLGHRNIFEYYFFGQETSPKHCLGGASFGRSSLGLNWRPTGPKRSVFIAPHAFSQTNDVFTMAFWQEVIKLLLHESVTVTVNTPNTGSFGEHAGLIYSFKPYDYRALFEQISHQRLVLCGNTGIGWIAGACGVPLIAGQPKFFWFMDYRYDTCGVQSLVNIFGKESGADRAGHNFSPADPKEAARMVLEFF